jgi:hypothetical protein
LQNACRCCHKQIDIALFCSKQIRKKKKAEERRRKEIRFKKRPERKYLDGISIAGSASFNRRGENQRSGGEKKKKKQKGVKRGCFLDADRCWPKSTSFPFFFLFPPPPLSFSHWPSFIEKEKPREGWLLLQIEGPNEGTR